MHLYVGYLIMSVCVCVCVVGYMCICTMEIFNESFSSGRVFSLVAVDHIDNTLEDNNTNNNKQNWSRKCEFKKITDEKQQ